MLSRDLKTSSGSIDMCGVYVYMHMACAVHGHVHRSSHGARSTPSHFPVRESVRTSLGLAKPQRKSGAVYFAAAAARVSVTHDDDPPAPDLFVGVPSTLDSTVDSRRSPRRAPPRRCRAAFQALQGSSSLQYAAVG